MESGFAVNCRIYVHSCIAVSVHLESVNVKLNSVIVQPTNGAWRKAAGGRVY